MASKHGRDQAPDLQGFLSDLQDWELSFKDKDKKMKPQASNKSGEKYTSSGRASNADYSSSSLGQYDFLRNYGSIGDVSSGFMTEESLAYANSEKEQGNEYFKQKKYNEAIDCYSRSLVLSPNAVAYANRAMAYLKIKRYREAEEDCTEALNLDDRYIKAYSRRATARKELGKLKDAMDDAEFALRLEPENHELKKQFTGIKSLLEKVIIEKASSAMKSSVQDVLKTADSEIKVNGNSDRSASSCKLTPRNSIAGEVQLKVKDKQGSGKPSLIVEESDSKNMTPTIRGESKSAEASCKHASLASVLRNHSSTKQELKPSVQELASKAASRAMAEASRNFKAPKSAYEFENFWRGFSGDRTLQAQLLKVTPPCELAQIFKNALNAPMLVDIIKCVVTFFVEDMDLAVEYVENLAKVPRFDMLIMCLSATEKAEVKKIWDEVFCSEATPVEHAEILDNMRSKYFLK